MSNSGGSCGVFPGTSVLEIASYGVRLNSIVVGKPLLPTDADNGYVAPAQLRTMLSTAAAAGWSAGVMTWSWDPAQGPAWIQAVYP